MCEVKFSIELQKVTLNSKIKIKTSIEGDPSLNQHSTCVARGNSAHDNQGASWKEVLKGTN